jgi:hypothetical protein
MVADTLVADRMYVLTHVGPRFTSAPQRPSANGAAEASARVEVPGMRVTVVRGLDDAGPAMAVALPPLAALTGDV